MSICQCCGLCRKSRHETYVDDVFPPGDETSPVDAEMGKLIYYAKTSPNNLNRIAGYLLVKLRRAMTRTRYNQVEVAVSVMLRLLSDCSPQQVPHLADDLLSMVHILLEKNDTRLQVLASNTFASFCAVKEVTQLYSSVHYEFFVDRFSGLSIIAKQDNDVQSYYNARMAGLKGLQGMLSKASSSSGLQYNIWELHCMQKIIPALLLNMQMSEEAKAVMVSEDTKVGQLAVFSEDILKELVSSAGLGHIDAVLQPVLTHLDVNKCWMEHPCVFAYHVFVIIMDSIQVQFRYKAVQALIGHLDKKGNLDIANPSAKRGILDTVSQCIQVASEGFLGPSAMDAFTVLLKHLKGSLDECVIRDANIETLKQNNAMEYGFQHAIITTVGNVSKVLPDYEKSHVMSLIISYIPENPGDDNSNLKSVMVTYQLLQCLKEVTFCYTTMTWSKTFPETLFSALKKLFLPRRAMLQLQILDVWLYLLDSHDNRKKIPLSISWNNLKEVDLVFGTEGNSHFMKKQGGELFKLLIQYSKLLPLEREVMAVYYRLLAVIVLECGKNKLNDCLHLIIKLQCLVHNDYFNRKSEILNVNGMFFPAEEIAVKETFMEQRVRVGLHCIVGGLMHLLSRVIDMPTLQNHVETVMLARRKNTPHFIIDNFFGGDSPDNPIAPSPLSPSEGLDKEVLFDLELTGLLNTENSSPSPAAASRSSFHSILMKHKRNSDTGSIHSLDYNLTESDSLNTEQMTYNALVADLNSSQKESSVVACSPVSNTVELSLSTKSGPLDIAKLISSDSDQNPSVTNRMTPKSAFDVTLPTV